MRLPIILLALSFLACDENERLKREKNEDWNKPCTDMSWLLATSSGSPSFASCPNKYHHMKVQVATASSNEEVAALVFCSCSTDRDGG